MKEKKYLCKCGCVVNRSDLIRVKTRRNLRQLQCPEHSGGKAEYRVFKCVKCGEIAYAKMKANNKIICDDCLATPEKPRVLWVTDCPDGECRLTEDEVFSKKVQLEDGRWTHRKVCKAHGGGLIRKEIRCRECGKYFIGNLSGPVPDFCDSCKNKKKEEKAAAKEAKAVAELVYAEDNDDADRGDCVHRRKCLDKAILEGKDVVPCKNCPDYISLFMGAA